MHTINPPVPRLITAAADSSPEFRQPQFECTSLPHGMKIEVCIPGVEAGGVEITSRGPDLVVVAHKPHPVRVNWQALHLEAAQRDYELKLRLGHGLDLSELTAEMANGILTIVVPKRHHFVTNLVTQHVA